MLVLFASRALPHIRGTARRLDMLSVALNAGSFASFVIGAEVLPTRPALAVALLTMLCGLGFGLFQVPNNQNMFLAAPRERSGAAGGMQGTARLAGQTAGAIVMTLLFTLESVDAAPRIGLGIAAVLALAAGLVSVMRARPHATSPNGIPH